MKKRTSFRIITATILLAFLSGCFPVYVPVDAGHGMGGGHEHREHHEDRDQDDR